MSCCKHQWPELFLRQDVSSEPGRSFYKLQMPGPHSSRTYWIGTPRAGSKGSAIDSGCDAAWEPLMQADWTRESLKRSIFSYWKLLGTSKLCGPESSPPLTKDTALVNSWAVLPFNKYLLGFCYMSGHWTSTHRLLWPAFCILWLTQQVNLTQKHLTVFI